MAAGTVTALGVQGLGLAGFALILASTRARTKRTFLVLDAGGVALVAAHYLALGQIAGAAYSLLYGVMDVAALYLRGTRARFLPIGALVFIAGGWIVSGLAPLAALAAAGSALAVLGRFARGLTRTLLFVAASTTFWGLYGVFAGSWPQIAFSTAYGVLALWRVGRVVYRLRRRGNAPSH
ncbi:YgjV family protein [Hyphobacterium marinum]|uniref:YgjV family protein n=1 Tax=Hyphobacterium marinum TaxID=3116574 RepID=A0ABU7LWI5_9PROT|nr:YgjV family protein [Hyphobacterium sp. Y6023]MEE2565884.1 YgjV family protein [Hyphobacterium sp. Y6023]